MKALLLHMELRLLGKTLCDVQLTQYYIAGRSTVTVMEMDCTFMTLIMQDGDKSDSEFKNN